MQKWIRVKSQEKHHKRETRHQRVLRIYLILNSVLIVVLGCLKKLSLARTADQLTILQFDNGKKYLGGFLVGSVFVPGVEENAIFINAHFNVIDTKTKQNVWSVEDKRDKEGTTKKKGMFKRIISDFSSSFINVLQTKKPSAKSVKKVGFWNHEYNNHTNKLDK